MKKVFPIFVMMCIGFVVIGSRASRPDANGKPHSGEAKVVETKVDDSLRQATAHASNR